MTKTMRSGTPKDQNIAKRVYLPPTLVEQIKQIAGQRDVPESHIVCEALESYLNPKPPDFILMEKTIAGSLDRLRRAVTTVQKDQQLTFETLVQFVRLFLINIPIPDDPIQQRNREVAPDRFKLFLEAVRSQTNGGGYVREVLNDDSE